jgi:hypothetical protein
MKNTETQNLVTPKPFRNLTDVGISAGAVSSSAQQCKRHPTRPPMRTSAPPPMKQCVPAAAVAVDMAAVAVAEEAVDTAAVAVAAAEAEEDIAAVAVAEVVDTVEVAEVAEAVDIAAAEVAADIAAAAAAAVAADMHQPLNLLTAEKSVIADTAAAVEEVLAAAAVGSAHRPATATLGPLHLAVAAAVDTVAAAEVAAAVDIVAAAEVAEAVDTVVVAAAVAAVIVTVVQPLPPYRRTVRPRRPPVTARLRSPAHRSRARVAVRSHAKFQSR